MQRHRNRVFYSRTLHKAPQGRVKALRSPKGEAMQFVGAQTK
jgi:hypothetical protein